MSADNESIGSGEQRRRFLQAEKEEANLKATRASVEKIARLCAQMGR